MGLYNLSNREVELLSVLVAQRVLELQRVEDNPLIIKEYKDAYKKLRGVEVG